MKAPTPTRVLPSPLDAERFLIRAQQYRVQAMRLVDMENGEPNWPKYFLMTHAVELALQAYLLLKKDSRPPRGNRRKLGNHDLMGLYEEAIRRGLNSSPLVKQDLPHLSELHKIHYARYPQIEVRPVALIGQFDDMIEQLFADIRIAFRGE